MSAMRRLPSALLLPLAVVLPVTLVTAGTAGPAAAAPVTAVVSYTADLPQVDGVRVQQAFPAVRSAVVTSDPAGLARLARTPGVRSVVPDRTVQVTGDDTEPSTTPTGVYANARIGGGAGRDYAGRGARIAVVDTGVSDSRSLNRASGRLVDAFDSRTGTDFDGPLNDGHGHGTFMATIAAGGPMPGTDGRALGVAPGATVLVVRVADHDGSTSLSKVIAGLDWVASHPDDVDVVNLSLGAPRPGDAYGSDPLTDAVEAVQGAGVTVVVASGNKPGELSDPGFLPPALTVGSLDAATTGVSRTSGYDDVYGSPKPDLVASGVSVLGVLPSRSQSAEHNPQAEVFDNVYRGSGTSQAAAVTSGAAALVVSRHPAATPADVKATLVAAAVAVDDVRAGAGRLRVPWDLVDAEEPAPRAAGSGSGEPSWAGDYWAASSWAASSWAASSWAASSWAASSWAASSWAASSWAASSWASEDDVG